jgi:hypothetical protein
MVKMAVLQKFGSFQWAAMTSLIGQMLVVKPTEHLTAIGVVKEMGKW